MSRYGLRMRTPSAVLGPTWAASECGMRPVRARPLCRRGRPTARVDTPSGSPEREHRCYLSRRVIESHSPKTGLGSRCVPIWSGSR